MSSSNSRIPSLWRERLASPLTWHYAGFAVLLVLVIGLSIRLGLDWATNSGSSADALASKQVQLRALDMETAPLRGLDKRVDESRIQMKDFYTKRIPPSYSSIDRRLGELALKGPVRLSRVQYTQGAASSDLTEISIEAGITGDYPQTMRFINGLESDKIFFVVRAMALTGQQGGQVNLRLRVSTWLKPSDVPIGMPLTQNADETTEKPAAGQADHGKEGQ